MAWVTIPDSDLDPDSPITTSLMTALRDNVAAALNRDAGAPPVGTNFITSTGQMGSNTVGTSELVNGAVSNAKMRNAAYGTNDIIASVNECFTTGTTYVKCKEFYIPFAGTYKMSFKMYNFDAKISYGRIYVNGVAVGTEKTTTSGSFVTFDQSITIAAGALVQLYFKEQSGGSYGAYVKDFIISESLPITPDIKLDLSGAV